MPARRTAIALLAGIAVAALVVACFPDIQFTDPPLRGEEAGDARTDTTSGGDADTRDAGGGGDAGDGAADETMVLVEAGSYPYAKRADGGVVTASLTHDFYIDIHEVSVRRLRTWALDRSRPVPRAGQSLDPGGPYQTKMVWDAEYNGDAALREYEGVNCNAGDFDGDASPTFRLAADMPANCINWAQALAICVSEGKRLPTEVEWYLVASNRGTTDYPWGNQAPDCTRATFASACGFPRPLGSTSAGKSVMYGMFDLAGSLRENVWDHHVDPLPLPDPFPADYAGPAGIAGDSRSVRGGWYHAGGNDIRPEDRYGISVGASWDGHGVRCAKTKL